MKANIKNLIAQNPSGLLEMQSSLSFDEYRENYGFELKNTYTIYRSKKRYHSNEDWFAFPRIKSLDELLKVEEESSGDLLVVYLVETIKGARIYCHLILSDQAFREILNDKSQHVLQVHQMYSKFFEDYIALNKTIPIYC
jgi:hypothetical protein